MLLVIGATGTIGNEVVRLLIARGVKVRAVTRDRTASKAQAIEAAGADLVEADLERPETLGPAFDGIEKAFLVTPFSLRQAELKSNAIQAAKMAGVRHVVMSTGIGTAPDAPLVIARMHAQSQQELQESGMAWTFLQPTFFMQNLLMFAQSIAKDAVFYQAFGDAKVSEIDARDIAAVGVEVLTTSGHEGKAYPLTGPEAISGDDKAAVLSDVLGKPVRHVPISLEQAREGMIQAGFLADAADAMNELNAIAAAGHAAAVMNTVEQVTGRPARSFRQFAEDYAPEFQG